MSANTIVIHFNVALRWHILSLSYPHLLGQKMPPDCCRFERPLLRSIPSYNFLGLFMLYKFKGRSIYKIANFQWFINKT